MHIRELFVSDVTRDISPVVYFHEQTPEKLAAEVSEYIITGGWEEGHPNHRRVPNGIHEQYVQLLNSISSELAKPSGPDLPTVWISGFYGSGKSSFAKLLGLSLDGVALPDGSSLADAWLRRDTSPKAAELRTAWSKLKQQIDPLAVVFDIGGVARDHEQLHSAAIRQLQKRLGYCSSAPHVADFELKLERDGEWARFEKIAAQVLNKPWSQVKDNSLAEEDFSLVMREMFPDRYADPMAWFISRGGTNLRADSPDDAVSAIRDMIRFRKPGATLFFIIDEVSQFVIANKDRSDRLRAFASALGTGMAGKSKAWLIALGQQKLDEQADDAFLVWAKDRFPPKLRVHLAATNIRDVVHKRLLQKRPEAERALQTLFEKHRPELKLFAYSCQDVTPDEFIEVYPMLPGQIDLILKLTTALRSRSARAQGDDQAIRGLLQLLGELFRTQKLADMPVGSLVTLDQIYEVQQTALDSDVQASMARILNQCSGESNPLFVRVAKAVALLELIQESEPTTAQLVAQCLYDRVDRGNNVGEVTEALDELRRRNLLGYSEKTGYKLQSSTGEEWEKERRDINVGRDQISALVIESLKFLLAEPEQPRLQGRPFRWQGLFSDGRHYADSSVAEVRDEATMIVDFRFLSKEESVDTIWVNKSSEDMLRNHLLWICGDVDEVDQIARELQRSRAMTKKYKTRIDSLTPARKLLLQHEENRIEDLEQKVRETVAKAWLTGRMFFRGRNVSPTEHGTTFASSLNKFATLILPEVYVHFSAMQLLPSELAQLLATENAAPSQKFVGTELGIFELDAGKYVPSCSGVIPGRIFEHIKDSGSVDGAMLLAHFGSPPYGYTNNVVKACIAGLLRGGKVRVRPESGAEVTAIRDAGAVELFDKDRAFRKCTVVPAGDDDIGPSTRARICAFFKSNLSVDLDREDHLIADAVAQHFPALIQDIRSVQSMLNRLPGAPQVPPGIAKLDAVLEQSLRLCRQTKPTVQHLKSHLDTLRDGVQQLQLYKAELTDAAVQAVKAAHDVLTFQAEQIALFGVEASNVEAAASRVRAHLSGDKPWRNIDTLEQDLAEIRNCYVELRRRLLQEQERDAEAARQQVKGRSGFATLTSDQSHSVLRPIAEVVTNTSDDAIAPSLVELRDTFKLSLKHAEERANAKLDELLSRDEKPMVQRVDLRLHNQEVTNEAEVDALVDGIKKRLLEHVRKGVRVRIV